MWHVSHQTWLQPARTILPVPGILGAVKYLLNLKHSSCPGAGLCQWIRSWNCRPVAGLYSCLYYWCLLLSQSTGTGRGEPDRPSSKALAASWSEAVLLASSCTRRSLVMGPSKALAASASWSEAVSWASSCTRTSLVMGRAASSTAFLTEFAYCCSLLRFHLSRQWLQLVLTRKSWEFQHAVNSEAQHCFAVVSLLCVLQCALHLVNFFFNGFFFHQLFSSSFQLCPIIPFELLTCQTLPQGHLPTLLKSFSPFWKRKLPPEPCKAVALEQPVCHKVCNLSLQLLQQLFTLLQLLGLVGVNLCRHSPLRCEDKPEVVMQSQ